MNEEQATKLILELRHLVSALQVIGLIVAVVGLVYLITTVGRRSAE